MEGWPTTTICAFNRWLGFGTAFYRSGEWFSVGLLQRPFAHLIFTFYPCYFCDKPTDLTFAGARGFLVIRLVFSTLWGFVAEPSFKHRRLFLAPYCADNSVSWIILIWSSCAGGLFFQIFISRNPNSISDIILCLQKRWDGVCVAQISFWYAAMGNPSWKLMLPNLSPAVSSAVT